MTLNIDATWDDAPALSGDSCSMHPPEVADWQQEQAAEEATVGTITLTVDGHLVTRMTDHRQRMHPGPTVSAYPLAEWLVWNWWRIRWEPGTGDRRNLLSWQQAHETASIGGGWLWPLLEFESDGRNIEIRSLASDWSATEPVSYQGGETRRVRAEDFEAGVDGFMLAVLSRLRDVGLPETPLHAMWRELQEERADPEAAAYRRFEALLGYAPDDGPEDRIGRLMAGSGDLVTGQPHGSGVWD